MSTIPPEPGRDYADEASVQDELLDRKLARIRADADAGTITVNEAADLRVAALEHHLEAIRYLRAEFFGGNGENT